MSQPLTPFHRWLGDHSRGVLDVELTAELARLVEAVASSQKPGKLTLELAVGTVGSGSRTVAVVGKIKMKMPEEPGEIGLFYVGDAGSLHRDDPYQERLGEGRMLPDDPPARLVDPETGEVVE